MSKTTPFHNDSYYHIYNRGNNKEVIFKSHSDYLFFLGLLKKYILPIAKIYAYCLLSNHFHLLVKINNAEINKAKIVEQQFSNLFNAYAKTFNIRHNRCGKLFSERFKRKEVKDNDYLLQLIYYIHSNPQRHKIIRDFRDYPYSSYHTFLSIKETAIERNEVLTWFSGKEAFETYHLAEHEQFLFNED